MKKITSFISKSNNKKIYFSIFLFIIFFIYILISLKYLTKFPYIHSDEPWLSGLSRTILDKGTFKTSEPFFDLLPRPIHGLKIIFVSFQIIVIKIFGYNIFSLRILSLFFSSISLIVIYKIIKEKSKNNLHSILVSMVIALNIQFIMSSHIARQESLILFGMLLSYYLTIKKDFKYKNIIIATSIGLLIGIHANSFLVGCGISLIYIYKYFKKEISIKELMIFFIVLITWACLFISISLYLNPNFFKEYLDYGNTLGVINNPINRFQGFFYYYYKLFKEIAGTYYLVNIKLEILLFILSIFTSILIVIKSIIKKKINISYSSIMIIGINLGYLIIGRYNQTAIIFTIVFTFILFFEIINKFFQKKYIVLILILLFAYELTNTYNLVSSTSFQDYNILGEKIKDIIPVNSKVLGNLNLDYHFNNYSLYDVRNLTFLSSNYTFSNYIKNNNIEYIILYEEMEYIYNSKSKWDILYGKLDYYEDMIIYLEKNCTLVSEFENPTYGMRISKYVDVYPWYTKIYKVNEKN